MLIVDKLERECDESFQNGKNYRKLQMCDWIKNKSKWLYECDNVLNKEWMQQMNILIPQWKEMKQLLAYGLWIKSNIKTSA